MKLLMLFGLTLLITPSPVAQDDDTKEEIKNLQGNWVRTSFSADGKSGDDGDRPPDKQVRLEIKGNLFSNMPFTLNVSKNPRHIDLKDIGPKGMQFTLPGIYELKGDVLKVCLPFPFEGKYDQIHKRPTEFVTKAGENQVVEVYRRVKK